MKYLLIVLIVCLAVSSNKVQSNENVNKALRNLSCNFENGFCGWTNDNSDNFDWTRHKGITGSFQTGPSGDHTPGLNGKGWYAYTDASFKPIRAVARLVTARFLQSGTYCLNFWFHMYGSGMGRLDILITRGNLSRLWSASGNHGNRWIEQNVTFTSNTDFKIVFQGTIASSYGSYMALDDIAVARGKCAVPRTTPPPLNLTCYNCITTSSQECLRKTTICPTSRSVCMYGNYILKRDGRRYYHAKCSSSFSECRFGCSRSFRQKIVTSCYMSCCQGDYCNRIVIPTTRQPPTPWPSSSPPSILDLNCNFENGICAWVNDRSDNFDWTRHRGSTPSYQTGPSGDHTPGLNGSGWYVYTETSPRQQGDVARLVSYINLRPGTYCLDFWYHMYGKTMGRLDVLTTGRNISSNLWSASGNHGNRWIEQNLIITSNTDFKIVFQGTRGSSYTGDMALDDITVSRGQCAGPTTKPPPCFCHNGGSSFNCNGTHWKCACFNGYYGDRCQYAPQLNSTTVMPTTPYEPPTTTPCFCHNGGSSFNCNGTHWKCACFNGYYGDRCQYAPQLNSTTVKPTTPYEPPTTPCFCNNGGSSFNCNGTHWKCACFNGYYGDRCQYAPQLNSTTVRPTTTPCFCHNGGSSFNCNGTHWKCACFNGYYGDRCQYAPQLNSTTVRPTTPACFCHNGGSSFNCNGTHWKCACFNGYYGDRCQYAPQLNSTTVRPTTYPSFSTYPPSTPQPPTCYSCSQASSPRECLRRTTRCFGYYSLCMYGLYTLKSSGRSYNIAGCSKSWNACQSICRNAFRRGIVTYCSISCCQTDYCNRIALVTTRRPPRPRTPNIMNSKFFLRLFLELLESFKALIDVTSTLLKAHLKSDDAQIKKREIVSMMKTVDDNAQYLENSRDPEDIKVKRDVDETRMRAKNLIAKLDDCIDDEPDKNNK